MKVSRMSRSELALGLDYPQGIPFRIGCPSSMSLKPRTFVGTGRVSGMKGSPLDFPNGLTFVHRLSLRSSQDIFSC